MVSAKRVSIRSLNTVLFAASALLWAGSAEAQSPTAQRGKAFVLSNCSACHSIDKITVSPLAIAPPFRNLHLKYPVENLEESLAEGIVTGHPSMPEFKLDPGQVSDVIAYLKSLE